MSGQAESIPKKKTSYLESLKRLPSRLRGKSESKVADKATFAKASGALAIMPPVMADYDGEENEDTNTVAQDRNYGVPPITPTTAKKLVVHATGSRSGAGSVNTGNLLPESEAPFLVYFTSYGSKVTYPLIWEESTIGRKDDCHIVLTDATISKAHASVLRKADGVYVVDKKSSNGVRINDQFLTPNVPTMVRNGDCLMVGSLKLMYCENTKAAGKGPEADAKSIAAANLKLVTILPAENQYDEQIAIKAEIDADTEEIDFKPVDLVDNINTLKEDYEKLRLAYELSKITLTNDINVHLEKSLDLIFEILPVDRGVVLLVDQYTGTLATQHVKLRTGIDGDAQEIVLSSTILKRVYESRKCLVTMDALEDKTLQAAASVMTSHIRSVICLPLIAHNKVSIK